MPLPESLPELRPTPYHEAVVAHLKTSEPELWRFAASLETEREHVEQVRGLLLKECYRLEADGHAALVERSCQVARRLGMTAPITLYQSGGSGQLNAALYHVPGEVHVMFTGPILATLGAAEIDAVLAHELAHYLLWEQRDREFLIADRLICAAAEDARAATSHVHTARRLRLYTEIFADRGAFLACGELGTAVAALVKMTTGLREVSATSYLRQADELFALGARGSGEGAHPELFIRARALRLWSERDVALDGWLAAEIERTATLDDLDLFGQERMLELTRRFLSELLAPAWMRSDALLAHARAFFPRFEAIAAPSDALTAADCSQDWCQEYLCYVLLDFCRVDPEVEDLAFAHTLACSERLGFQERFEQIAGQELGIGKRQLAKLKRQAATLLRDAGAS